MEQVCDKTVNLFDVGCLVNLNVGAWSGRKMLTRADMVEMKTNPDLLPEDIVNLGRKLLVPRSELAKITKIEQKARKALAQWSVPFGIANSHFVPIKKVNEVEKVLSELRDDFNALVKSFIERFSEMKNSVREKHGDFWHRCLQQHYPSSPEKLRSKFYFEWHLFKIAGMDSIQETDINELMANEQVKQEKINELRKTMKQEVEDFTQDYVQTMRKETIEFCNLVEARVNGTIYKDEQEAKKLTARSLTYFKKYIDKFSTMNVFEDHEVEKLLNNLKEQFLDGDVTPGDLDNNNVKNSLSQALSSIRKVAQQDEQKSEFLNSLKRNIVI